MARKIVVAQAANEQGLLTKQQADAKVNMLLLGANEGALPVGGTKIFTDEHGKALIRGEFTDQYFPVDLLCNIYFFPGMSVDTLIEALKKVNNQDFNIVFC